MWVIFLLSSLVVAIITLVVIYVGNKILIKMNNDWKENEKRKGEK